MIRAASSDDVHAATVGTGAGVGEGVGVGLTLGSTDGVSGATADADGVATAEGAAADGLAGEAEVVVPPHAATSSTRMAAVAPNTAGRNVELGLEVRIGFP